MSRNGSARRIVGMRIAKVPASQPGSYLNVRPGLGQRKIDRQELLVIKPYPTVLVRVEVCEHLRKLLHEHTRAEETIKSDRLIAYLGPRVRRS